MEINELVKELKFDPKLTLIQAEAKCKPYISRNVEINITINEITESKIILSNEEYFGWGWMVLGDLRYNIYYDKRLFNTQLMNYSKGDRVKIICKISDCSFKDSEGRAHDSCWCIFDLQSISKL